MDRRIDTADHLCWRDPRSSAHVAPEPDEEAAPPREGCACDPCFYGRDGLALKILALEAALRAAADTFAQINATPGPLLVRCILADAGRRAALAALDTGEARPSRRVNPGIKVNDAARTSEPDLDTFSEIDP